ncbi:AAA family ATPase [Streptomyces sp. 8L]|uniref:AAA family ATPase n=1 Tax=Streptomyces sp. 8L TaxID=2877242 RepID=UPI001CD2E0BC|nr:AAA family ATPase [Streptomyces sp. 8L]MCA1219174.1 AAA family ATPase [Streptomyces sp. 8L]
MIVLDGMPGAGKTTLLHRLRTALPDHLVVLPEAQPPEGSSTDAETAQHLLGTARERLDAARRLAQTHPDRLLASDRGHIGVLAYRYAMAATDRAPHSDFEHALALCHNLDLVRPHRDLTTMVLVTDPGTSITRRAAFAQDQRYSLWFDPEFLTAYRGFLDHLAACLPSDSFTTLDVTNVSGWPILLDILQSLLSRRLPSLQSPTSRSPEAV